ncbi:DUF58 domain-containing protein [Mycetocola spongiae]|uniref:DUF58 domain-containing protein n=1 Tax=Mycetocola spongiae TaxID=2859226 RepID=UPI001CF5FADE|nr:DUF58 domain-containing protein [Mycetocola spongiae]UCR90386.1 DUF58 domain-containing protein [Mycetocola spongiae]
MSENTERGTGSTRHRTRRKTSTTRTRGAGEYTATVTRTAVRSAAPGRGELLRRRAARLLRRARVRLIRVQKNIAELVTATGWFVLACGAAGLLAGALLGWVEGWFLAGLSLALVLLAGPFLLGGRAYAMTLGLERDRVFAGEDTAAWLEVRNLAAGPALPAIAELGVGPAILQIPVPLLGPRAERRIPVPLRAPRRGVIPVGPVTVSRRDPIGLFRRAVTWNQRHLLHVHPAIAALPQNSAGMVRDLEGQSSRRLTDSDLSFHAVRAYVRGDSFRHVHWRSTAKTGALMVRQYEESQLSRVAVLFDAVRAEYASDEEFELAVSAAASLSVQAVRNGRDRYIASAWCPDRGRPGPLGVTEIGGLGVPALLDSWAELEAVASGPRLERLAATVAQGQAHLSIVYIVTGSIPDMSRLRRAASAFAANIGVVVVRAQQLAEPAALRVDTGTVLTVGAVGDLGQLLIRGNN